MWRYASERGSYLTSIGLKTPIGSISVTAVAPPPLVRGIDTSRQALRRAHFLRRGVIAFSAAMTRAQSNNNPTRPAHMRCTSSIYPLPHRRGPVQAKATIRAGNNKLIVDRAVQVLRAIPAQSSASSREKVTITLSSSRTSRRVASWTEAIDLLPFRDLEPVRRGAPHVQSGQPFLE